MATKRKLGAYWGQNFIYFVECESTVPKKIFSAPLDGSKESGQGLKVTAVIQKALREQQISDATSISFAVPPQDIIFRSFVIPHMQPNEVQNVVEFEATKYVPFKLEELSYSYFPMPLMENRRKIIRILLIAVRKAILEQYCSIFEHSGLRVELVEPATVSLMRVLLSKRLIPKGKTTAIIEFANGEGRITIVDQDVPQFVREFQFYPEEAPNVTPDILRARLFNEIKISFDYFNRQHAQKKIDKIIALTRTETTELLQTLGDDFSIPATLINLHTLMNAPSGHENGFLSAYGVCLRNIVAPKVNFDLTWKAIKPKETPKTEIIEEPNYALVGITAVICAGIIGASAYFSNQMTTQPHQRVADLKKELGIYESADVSKMEADALELNKKAENYKHIRLQSKLAHYLNLIPELLPEGTWISDIEMLYPDNESIHLMFTAHAYSKESNRQFELANNLIKNFKNNKDFSGAFAKIELGSIETDKIQDYIISRFRVTCR